jgi:DNA-binding PadR family transcriptional regulator
MSLRYAILGLLARESLTGYDLTKRFDTTIAFFWSAKHSQIYPELAALTKEGLVTFEVVTQTSKPNKKVYTITEQGCEALASWIAEPREKRTVKDPLLLRAWAIGVVDSELVLPHLREALEQWNKRVHYLEEVEKAPPEAELDGFEHDWAGAMMSLRLGIMQARTYREWLQWAIDKVETMKKEKAPAHQA